jgi:hypothetical protein
VRLVNFGHLGDGNLHYNVQAPEESDARVFLSEQEDRVNTLVFDSVARFAPDPLAVRRLHAPCGHARRVQGRPHGHRHQERVRLPDAL